MTIKVGDRVPDGKFKVMTENGPKGLSTEELFNGKRVVLFSVPGAFTPTCSAKHLPGYLGSASQLHDKGVDTIACMAVNDVFVMGAWGKASNCGEKVLMLADGNVNDYDASARARARCSWSRYGSARSTLRLGGQQRGGRAAERRGPRSIQGLFRRARAHAALTEDEEGE